MRTATVLNLLHWRTHCTGARCKKQEELETADPAGGRIMAFISGKRALSNQGPHRCHSIIYSENKLGEGFQPLPRADLGHVFASAWCSKPSGGLSVNCDRVELVTKSLRPMRKISWATDIEIRYRQRYLDLIVNDDSRKYSARSESSRKFGDILWAIY